jgi:perosamine synthetase
MTDMQAALGLCQLELLDGVLEDRRRLAERYNAALAPISHLELPYEPDYATRTWQSYAVKLRSGAPVSRTELQRRLLRDGVATRRGVTAIHAERAYSDRGFLLPHTDACARDALMLPLFADLSEEQQDYVVERLTAHVSAAAAA